MILVFFLVGVITYFFIVIIGYGLQYFSFLLQTWNPKSKLEPYAQSAAELMKLAATTVDEFFQVPIAITEDLVQDLVDGLENLFQEYMNFVASCGKNFEFINRGKKC